MGHGDAELVLTLATPADAEAILALYHSQIGQGTSDWSEEYPTMDFVREDIEAGRLYVHREADEIIAAVTLMDEDDLDALPIWTEAKSCIPTRLCVARTHQGRGLAGQMMAALSGLARAKGYAATRHLCSKSNTAALRVYQRMGYDQRGECELYGITFFCFEKLL